MDDKATWYDVNVLALVVIANCGHTQAIRAMAVVVMVLLFLARHIIRGKHLRKS